VIVVVASVVDDDAAALPDRWPNRDVVVLTPLDLSTPGWSTELGRADGRFVANGAVLPSAAIEGVLVRLPAVPAAEMLVLAEEDREYAACEATAFLAWWLSTLRCPVVNHPTPTSLVGPVRQPLVWDAMARRSGVSTHPALRVWPNRHPELADITSCTVLDGVVVKACDPRIEGAAVRLAELGGYRLCGFGFGFSGGEPHLAAVTLTPPLDDALRNALAATFS
jgi:hypothetical protein